MPKVGRREKVDRVTLAAQFADQEVNADADPVKDRQGTVGKERNP